MNSIATGPTDFWVVLVNYNGWDDTILCMRSFEPVRSECSVVMVDNASRDDRCDELRREFPWCHVVREPQNGGWAGGNNAGLRYSLERGARHVVLLNNDTTVAPDFVTVMRNAAEQYPEYGVLGPVIHHMDEPDVVMTDGCLFNRPGFPGFFQRLEVPVSHEPFVSVTDVDIVNGCCLMVSRAVCDRIGLVDERFFLIHEESDFCLRARQAGFKCGVIDRSLVWHKGSSSFKRTGQKTQRYYDARNLQLLLKKHIKRHSEGRGTTASYITYFNYLYYRYATELENGCPAAAEAVVEGTYDAFMRRYGPYQARRRVGLSFLNLLFVIRRVLTAWKPRKKEKQARAAVVR